MALASAGCGAVDTTALAIGHGGAGYSATNPYAPNSQPSLERALITYDADGVEIDVQVAADGTLVAFHDAFLDAKTDCGGRIVDKSVGELRTCRYRHHQWEPGNDRILTLDEAIDVALRAKPSAHLFLDLKTFTARAAGKPIELAYVEGLAKVTDAVNKTKLWFISGSERVLFNLKLFLGSSAAILADADNGARGIAMADDLALEGIVVRYKKVSRAQVAAMQAQGKIVVVYGVKSYTAAKEALTLEPEAIQADDLPGLQAAMDQ